MRQELLEVKAVLLLSTDAIEEMRQELHGVRMCLQTGGEEPNQEPGEEPTTGGEEPNQPTLEEHMIGWLVADADP